MIVSRRHLLRLGGAASFLSGANGMGLAQSPSGRSRAPSATASERTLAGPADYTIRIATSLIELGPDTTVSTKTYNGQFPGPLLRLTEGKRVTIDVHNDTDTPELVHWHGQFVPAEVDGAAEEGTPFIPAHAMRRIAFVPRPAGFRFYHSHVAARTDLSAGTYSGQAAPLFIAPLHDPGAYDQEIFLTLKEFGPFLTRTEMPVDFLAPTDEVPGLHEQSVANMKAALAAGRNQGYELAYNFFAVNGRMLGQGEPIRVKPGERVLFHILNASATEIRSLHLPGHAFKVVALDGNPVPNPAEVPALWLGTAERVSAIVEMKQPGIWVMGDLMDEDRTRGMGIVVEYAGREGEPQWITPQPYRWDYRNFAKADAKPQEPEEIIDMVFAARIGARDGFDEFTVNGLPFSMAKMEPLFRLTRGRRYRLRMTNATDDVHPVHLHRHSFEITSIAGHPMAGVIKDVAMIGSFQTMNVDFTADQPGRSLFHCHMQQHMDFGFMALFDCRG